MTSETEPRPDHLWIGYRDQPNELLLRNPALMGAAGRMAAALPGGHVEGFGEREFAGRIERINPSATAGQIFIRSVNASSGAIDARRATTNEEARVS